MTIIATPTRGQLEASTASDVAYLMRHSPDTEWAIGFGSIIANNRTLLVHTASQSEASHILFVDSDIRLPKDSLERLLAHKKDIVGANFKQRTRDEWTARKYDKFITSVDKKGLEKVDTLGMGVTLINMNVFKGSLRSVPVNCFAQPFDSSTGIFVGEDIYFCTMAGDAGFEVWVDHDLSQEVKHIGSIELGIDNG